MKITVIQCGENQWMFKIFGGKIHGKVVRKQQKGFSTKYDQYLVEAATPAESETTISDKDSGTEERVKIDALTFNQAYTEFIEQGLWAAGVMPRLNDIIPYIRTTFEKNLVKPWFPQ